ncbi:MAG: DUF4328 domain-containing protein [Verrucomicrobia bacterium]|nr:DUF4328 domain-containing protein [Verrucomicrobiota bacterium]
MSAPDSIAQRDELNVADLKPPPLTPPYLYKCPLLPSRLAQGALFIYLLVSLAGSAFTALQIALIFLDEKGTPTPPVLWEINAAAHHYEGYITLAVFVITAAFFGLWLHRVASNALSFNPRALPDTPAMSVGWYFIPIANLFKPYQSMQAIDKASSTHGPHSAARLLPWWWALWLLTGWVEQAFEAFWNNAETNAEIMKVTAFYEVTYLGSCALTILAMMIVRRVTTAQMLQHHSAIRSPA